MTDERSSPSAGWRTVYREMGVSTDVEADALECPDCGRDAPRVGRAVFWCPDHGRFDAADRTAASA